MIFQKINPQKWGVNLRRHRLNPKMTRIHLPDPLRSLTKLSLPPPPLFPVIGKKGPVFEHGLYWTRHAKPRWWKPENMLSWDVRVCPLEIFGSWTRCCRTHRLFLVEKGRSWLIWSISRQSSRRKRFCFWILRILQLRPLLMRYRAEFCAIIKLLKTRYLFLFFLISLYICLGDFLLLDFDLGFRADEIFLFWLGGIMCYIRISLWIYDFGEVKEKFIFFIQNCT